MTFSPKGDRRLLATSAAIAVTVQRRVTNSDINSPLYIVSVLNGSI